MLGVCLGHQGLAHVRGGTVVRGTDVVHGRISPVFHRGDGLFAGIPQGFRAVRYHSLVVEPALPASLEALAWSDDGTVMAIGARGRRAWGVQFHPESIATEHGARLVANFLALTPPARGRGARRHPAAAPAAPRRRAASGAVHVEHRVVDGAPDAERAFAALFGEREHAFWLDSSRVDPELSRFSFIGAAMGVARRRDPLPRRRSSASPSRATARPRSTDEPLLSYLSRELARLHTAAPQLPFDLNGGFVGYLGYECKADCGARRGAPRRAARRVPGCSPTASWRSTTSSGRRTCSRCRRPGDEAPAVRWADATAAALDRAARRSPSRRPPAHEPPELRVRARAAAASTTWRTSRPASGCSRPARATRSASPTASTCPRPPTASSSTASCAASTRRRTARTCGCARARSSARRPSASCACAATARSRRSRSRARRSAAPTRSPTRAARDAPARERRRTAPSTS